MKLIHYLEKEIGHTFKRNPDRNNERELWCPYDDEFGTMRIVYLKTQMAVDELDAWTGQVDADYDNREQEWELHRIECNQCYESVIFDDLDEGDRVLREFQDDCKAEKKTICDCYNFKAKGFHDIDCQSRQDFDIKPIRQSYTGGQFQQL